MSTRSTIAFRTNDNKIQSIYCHWDGYPENNGKILVEHYDSKTLVEMLTSLGDLSSLGETVFESTFYHRERGEAWNQVKPQTFESEEKWLLSMSDSGTEYSYIFEEGKWRCFNSDHIEICLEKEIEKKS